MKVVRYTLSFITALLSFIIWGLSALSLNAQVPTDKGVSFPSFHKLCYDTETGDAHSGRSNIDRFFAEWESWSGLIANGSTGKEYNEIFKKHFSENNAREKRDSKYLSLPLMVKVIRYDSNIHPDSIKVKDYTSILSCLMNSRKPESISYFTPVIESDKKVLYLLPEAVDMLTAFIQEPETISAKNETAHTDKQDIRDEVRKRRDMIREYLPAVIAHWGDGWYFTSYPLIECIIVGNDGYYIGLNDANYSGEQLFVPYEKEPMVLWEWLQ